MARMLAKGMLLVVLTLVIGCTGGREAEGELTDVATLVNQLEEEGVNPVAQGPAVQPFFTVTGQEFLVTGGGVIQVFEYDNEAAAQLDASRIDLQAMDVATPPHFYQRGNLLVAYFGDDTLVEQALADVLGPRIL